MKSVKYDQFKNKIKKNNFLPIRIINRSAPRRRPRDAGEAENLARLTRISWERAIASGKLQKKGARRYSLNIDVK